MGERLTKALVCDALRMAVGRYGTPRLHHSDRVANTPVMTT